MLTNYFFFFFFKNWYFIKFPELETKHIGWRLRDFCVATRFKSSTLFCRSFSHHCELWVIFYLLFNVSRVSTCGRTTCFRVKRGRRSSLFCQLQSNTSKNPVTWTPFGYDIGILKKSTNVENILWLTFELINQL